METLTKENFWNRAMIRWPHATTLFYTWIDEYKKRNNWDFMFNSPINYSSEVIKYEGSIRIREVKTCTTKSPKFHDLPGEMQFGIYCQFLIENKQKHTEIYLAFLDLEGFVSETLSSLDYSLK